MKLKETLQSYSLDELTEMFVEATTKLWLSKIDDDDSKGIKENEMLVNSIKNAIVEKQAELPPPQ
jgi:hypothetical protein